MSPKVPTFAEQLAAARSTAVHLELHDWLPRRQASDIALPGNDFWLFDDQLVRFNHFTGDGESAGPSFSDDPAVARLRSTAFASAWERAVPHEKYSV
ncbi:DUF6879 family protein [Kitasatospora brasiliensis]|uniref:DUF6879 family protein n=1 Tax=Kitasatospora brasiliensis TaxID=3058040 RepID=UPI003D778E1A